MATTPPLRRQVIAAGAANLLPFLGALVLGWKAAGVIFFLWLDALLGLLELAGINMAVSFPEMRGPGYEDKQGRPLLFVRIMIGIIVIVGVSSPAILAAVGLYALLHHIHPEGVLGAVFSEPGILPAAGLAIGIRAVQAILRFRKEGPAPFKSTALAKFVLLIFRCLFMYALAFMVRPLGHYGLIGFVLIASAALFWFEIHEDRIVDRIIRMGPPGPAAKKPSAMP